MFESVHTRVDIWYIERIIFIQENYLSSLNLHLQALRRTGEPYEVSIHKCFQPFCHMICISLIRQATPTSVRLNSPVGVSDLHLASLC